MIQQLQEQLAALAEENHQLVTDAQENVEMVKGQPFGRTRVVPVQKDPGGNAMTCFDF